MSEYDHLLDEDFLDKDAINRITSLVNKLRRRYFIFFIVTALVNVLLAEVIFSDSQNTLTYSNPLASFFAGPIVVGTALGVLFNFIPYKGIPYKRKFMSTVFLIAAITNLLIIISQLLR